MDVAVVPSAGDHEDPSGGNHDGNHNDSFFARGRARSLVPGRGRGRGEGRSSGYAGKMGCRAAMGVDIHPRREGETHAEQLIMMFWLIGEG